MESPINLTIYQKRIANRSRIHFLLGILTRLRKYLYYKFTRKVARCRGAHIGKNVTMPLSFAKKLGPLITIGDNTSIHSNCDITGTFYPVIIGKNVIIGQNVKLILRSHNIDSPEWESKQSHNSGLIIEDYVWICPHSIILPSVKNIQRGAVVGAGSVVSKDIATLEIVSGNPAQSLRHRKCVHSNVVVESLLGGDLVTYIKTYIHLHSK